MVNDKGLKGIYFGDAFKKKHWALIRLIKIDEILRYSSMHSVLIYKSI